MRGKKAKALRRIAREATVGLPDRQLVNHKPDPNAVGKMIRLPYAVNALRTTRGVYRALKKEAKRRRSA